MPPSAKSVKIESNDIYLSTPSPIPERTFIGREKELNLCKAAWGIEGEPNSLAPDNVFPLNFRLQGPPGVGKNEIVYQIARLLKMPLYMIQGHEELAPEDLAILLAPDPNARHALSVPLLLRASPLATAIHEGGLFFFDEINRVPERALAPLSSVLDERRSLYSAITGVWIGPKDKEAERRFRFCCALNPELSEAGFILPDYIAQRTLPVVRVDYPPLDDLREVLRTSLNCPDRALNQFATWYKSVAQREISVRQALALMVYALKLSPDGTDFRNILKQASPLFGVEA